MRLNISVIPEDGLQQELRLPIAIDEGAGPNIADVSVKIFRINKKVLVEGSVRISVLLTCSRCLKDFSYPLDMSFREEYNPAEEISREDEQELTGKEPDLGFYSNDEIDISELVKEQALLSVPMKPLCISGCRGICTRCGKDLNEGSCECKTEKIDARLAPLQKIKELIKDRKE